MASNVQVRTVEVAVESSAGKALGNIDALIERLDVLAQTLQTVVTKAGGLATIGKSKGSSGGLKSTTKEVEKTSKAVSEMSSQVDKFIDKMTKTGFTGVEKSAKASYKAVKDYADEMKRFGVDTEQKGVKFLYQDDAKNAGKRFRSLNSGMSHADKISREARGYKSAADVLGFKSAEASSTTKMLDMLVTASTRAQTALGAAKSALSDFGGRVATGAVDGMSRLSDKVVQAFQFTKTFASYLGGAVKKAFDIVRNAIHGVRNALGKMSSAFKSALSSIKSFAHGLAHPISTLKSMFGMGGRSGGGLLGGLLRGRSLGQFIGLIVLRRAITSALRAIVSGIKEGFENIRNYSSAINSEMNSIQNSLLYVKNAWAAAFAPIVSVVRPYINYLLDAIAAALNALGRLVALLTGKGFAVQAVKLSDAMYEAGKAGEAAAGGTGKATKAAEEYKKTIMGFDQLHVLNAQDSGSGGSGGGGGGGGGADAGINVNDMFTTVSLAGAFKDAIDAEDWEELGRLMAEKVNSAFGKLNELISWENVGDKITKTVNAITTTLNSLVDNVDWNLIGTTVGSGINTLVNTWNTFFDGFDFINLGTKIAEGVNGLFDRVDWTALGKAVTQKFKALWETIGGFVSTLDWGNVGTAVGNALNGALSNISLPDIGATIGRAISGASIAIKNFTLTFDWDDAFEQIKGFFVNLLEGINSSDFLGALGGVAAKIVGGLADVLSDSEVLSQLETFASNLGEKLGSLEWVTYLGKLAIAIVQALETLLSGLLEGFIQGLLIKLGVSPEDASAAFDDKDAYENYNLTGDPRWLPGGEFYEAAKLREVEVTAKATHFLDDIADNEKVVDNSTAVVDEVKDNAPKGQKTSTGWTARFEYYTKKWWSYANKDWTIGGFTAQFNYMTKKWWSYKNADWTTKGWVAQHQYVNKKWDKGISWSTSGWSAIVSRLDPSQLTSKQKQVAVVGILTEIRNGGANNGLGLTFPGGRANGGLFSGGTWKPITRYASGGSPNVASAELFMAREAGPELVGRIGSRTAVMNNNQIVSSVAAGVKSAVAEAIMATRSTADSGMPYQINVTVKTQDDEVLARCVERGQARRSYRLGTA